MSDATNLPGRQKALILVGAMLGMLLAALDQTIVATAGPTIQRELKIDPSLYTWITTSYLVASTVLVPIWGKLSDMLGRRRVLLTGIGVFLLGSVLCGIASTATELIVFRAVQGMGSASLFTSALAIIADLFTPAERGKFQGIFGAVFGLSSVVGPLVGGFITDHIGWHWCFFVNLPVGAVAVGFILAKMPPLRPAEQKKISIDVVGAMTLAIGVVPLLLALSLGRATLRDGETGYLWGSWQIAALAGVAVVGFIAFILVEGRVRDPIVDLKLFSNRTFAIGNFAAFVAGAPFLGAIVFLPLFMVNVVGATATSSGLTTVPLTFGIIAGNILSGQLVSRTGKYKPWILGAAAILSGAFAIMAFTLSPETTKLEASWKMFFVGLGLGPGIPLYTLVIQNAVPPQVIGTATSVATFVRQMGSTVGLAVLGTVFATTLSSELEVNMKAATEGVPPEMVAQFQRGSSSSSGGEEGGPSNAAFNRVAVEEKIHAAFASQRDLVTRAIEKDDPAAMAELAKSPRVDERMKAALAAGGLGAQVKAGFDAMYARIEKAVNEGPDAVAALANDPSLPPPLAERLKSIPAPALADPGARMGILKGIQAGLDAAAVDATAKARAGALEGATKGLNDAETKAIETVGKVEHALKVSFTNAIARIYLVALLFAVLVFLTSLLVPVLPLRGRGPGAGSPPAAME